jgi:hypothetical protein
MMMLGEDGLDDGFSPYNGSGMGDYFPVSDNQMADNGPALQYQNQQAQQMQQQRQLQQPGALPAAAAQQQREAVSAAAMYPPTQSQRGLSAAPLAFPVQQPQQPLQLKTVMQPMAPSEPGYFESLWDKRRAIFKLAILSLVVLLAISGHHTVWHYLTDYIDRSAALTFSQELALRMAYPAAVLIVLWHVKTFVLD